MANSAPPPGIHVTYELQRRKCGKADCKKCRNGGNDAGHGPYWYGFWHQRQSNGKTKLRSFYVGKQLPPGASLPKKYQKKPKASPDMPQIPPSASCIGVGPAPVLIAVAGA